MYCHRYIKETKSDNPEENASDTQLYTWYNNGSLKSIRDNSGSLITYTKSSYGTSELLKKKPYSDQKKKITIKRNGHKIIHTLTAEQHTVNAIRDGCIVSCTHYPKPDLEVWHDENGDYWENDIIPKQCDRYCSNKIYLTRKNGVVFITTFVKFHNKRRIIEHLVHIYVKDQVKHGDEMILARKTNKYSLIPWRCGLKHGTQIKYNEDGNSRLLKTVTEYRYGEKHGRMTRYHYDRKGKRIFIDAMFFIYGKRVFVYDRMIRKTVNRVSKRIRMDNNTIVISKKLNVHYDLSRIILTKITKK